jgi:hypothetical protein
MCKTINLHKKINHCLDCNKEIDNRSKRCNKCHFLNLRVIGAYKNPAKGIKNGNWKGGLSKCKDCNDKVSRRDAIRCKKCHLINLNKDRTKFTIKVGKEAPRWNGGKIKLNCDFCNKIIYRWNFQLKIHKKHFCTKECYYKLLKITMTGKNNPSYLHGGGKLPYPMKFSLELKSKIRHRDGNKCQHCNISNKTHKKRHKQQLHIHHIDYNVNNCDESNLITLCNSCNQKANKDRDYWYAYYTYIMVNR